MRTYSPSGQAGGDVSMFESVICVRPRPCKLSQRMGTVLKVPETDSPAPAGVFQELDEVGQFLAGDLFVEAGGHEGDG